jgi:hypothetical protein
MPTARDGAVDQCAAAREKSESCPLVTTQVQHSKATCQQDFAARVPPTVVATKVRSNSVSLTAARFHVSSPTACVLVAIVLTAVGCDQSRTAAIQVIPPVADAKDFPGEVVSFTATGVTNATWCIGTIAGHCNANMISLPASIPRAMRSVFRVGVEQLRFWPEPAFIAGYPIRAANYPS